MTRSWFRKPQADRLLLIRALLLVIAVRVGLWMLPFRLIRRMVRMVSKPLTKISSPDPANIGRISWAIGRASCRVPHASCLTQALAASILLAWHGFDADLHIGVTKDAGKKFAAHAWLISQGLVVTGGSELRQFQPLLVLKGDRA